MTSQSLQLAQILRSLAKLIERAGLSETQRLLDTFEDSISSAKTRETQGRATVSKSRLHMSADEIMNRLQTAPDRETGALLLRELSLSKRDLLDLARDRSVHITKEDNLRRIEEKLVEAVIGSKLNSQAIRGTSDEK